MKTRSGQRSIVFAYESPTRRKLQEVGAIRPDRLHDVGARRPSRGVWAQLRAGVHDAVPPRWAHRRGLRAEREAERMFEMSPCLLAVAGFDGRTWGVLTAIWTDGEPPPDDTGQRMAGFAELLDTAIANADSRDQLTASRARLLAAGDDARRPVVRNLHDGSQRRLVHTIIALSSRSRRSMRTGATRSRYSRTRSGPRSGRHTRCASSHAGSCPRSSPTAGCAPASTRSCPDWIFPSTSTC